MLSARLFQSLIALQTAKVSTTFVISGEPRTSQPRSPGNALSSIPQQWTNPGLSYITPTPMKEWSRSPAVQPPLTARPLLLNPCDCWPVQTPKPMPYDSPLQKRSPRTLCCTPTPHGSSIRKPIPTTHSLSSKHTVIATYGLIHRRFRWKPKSWTGYSSCRIKGYPTLPMMVLQYPQWK